MDNKKFRSMYRNEKGELKRSDIQLKGQDVIFVNFRQKRLIGYTDVVRDEAIIGRIAERLHGLYKGGKV